MRLDVPGTRILDSTDPLAPIVAEIAPVISGHLQYRGAILPLNDNAYPAVIGSSPWSVPGSLAVDTGAALAL